MADQLPIIRETRAINASATTSTSLLGRGLAAIQSGKLAESPKFDEQKLLSLLCKIMDLASRLGHLTFKENARYVLDVMCEKISDTDIDKITIDHLQGCYIEMKKGTTSKTEVVNIKSIEELYLDDELSPSSHSQVIIRDKIQKKFDGETLRVGAIAAVYHIEAGEKSFADYTQAMITEFGENIRPYLRGIYHGVRLREGFDSSGMDDYNPTQKPYSQPTSENKSNATKKPPNQHD
ncbi:MAG: hypothetical protein WCP96_18490 [Methylococcaceae bacterium]